LKKYLQGFQRHSCHF